MAPKLSLHARRIRTIMVTIPIVGATSCMSYYRTIRTYCQCLLIDLIHSCALQTTGA